MNIVCKSEVDTVGSRDMKRLTDFSIIHTMSADKISNDTHMLMRYTLEIHDVSRAT